MKITKTFARKKEDYHYNCKAASAFMINHRTSLEKDSKCGCCHCKKIFHPKEIKHWIPDKKGTAICPYCGMDAIIGESSRFPITEDFLTEMYDYYFGTFYRVEITCPAFDLNK